MAAPELPSAAFAHGPESGEAGRSAGGGDGTTESKELDLPLRVQIGKPFVPFEGIKITDISFTSGEQLILEKQFVLDGIGTGCFRLEELVTVTDSEYSPLEADVKKVDSYSNPFGTLRFECNASPDLNTTRRWRAPLGFDSIELALYQPKTEVVAPVVKLDFQNTPYRYWAVDTRVPSMWDRVDDSYTGSIKAQLSRNRYDPENAFYYWWYSEWYEMNQDLAINQNEDELSNIQVTFLSIKKLPFHDEVLRPYPLLGLSSGTPPPPRRDYPPPWPEKE